MTTTAKMTVLCGQCRAELAVPATAAGQKARCPNCQGVIVVPRPEPVPLPPPPESIQPWPDAEPPRPKAVRPFFAAAVDPKDTTRVWPAEDEPAPTPPEPVRPEPTRSVPVRPEPRRPEHVRSEPVRKPVPPEQRETRPTPPAPKAPAVPKTPPAPVTPPVPKRATAQQDHPATAPKPRRTRRGFTFACRRCGEEIIWDGQDENVECPACGVSNDAEDARDGKAARPAGDEAARRRKIWAVAGGVTAAGFLVLFAVLMLRPGKQPADRVRGDQAGLKLSEGISPRGVPSGEPAPPGDFPRGVAVPSRPGEFPQPVTHWSFDEGDGEVASDSRSRATGTLREGARWVAGIRGSALEFDGQSAWFEFGPSTPLSFGDNAPFTIGCWVKPRSNRHGPVFSFRGERHPHIDMATIVGVWVEKGKLCSWLRKDGSPFFPNEQFGRQELTLNEWHHVALVRHRDGTAEVYQDGVLATRRSSRESGGGFTLKYGSLGREMFPHHRVGERDDPTTKHLEGAVDEFAAFDRALTAAEIAKLAGR